MTTKRSRMLWSLIAVLILGCVSPIATAQQGHSPSQSTPESAAVTQPAAESVDWQVENVTLVEIEGTPVTMSPDGAWIAGINPDQQLCVWEVVTMEPTCDKAERIPIAAESLAWSPDSTAIAFTEDAFMRAYESDIHVYELGASESVNITDDGIVGGLLDGPEDGPMPGDVMPVWTLDSQSLIFARSDFGAEERTTDLMRVARGGGEPEFLDTVSIDPFTIYMPMHVLSDGSLLFAQASPDLDDPYNGFWLRTAQGELRHVLAGDEMRDYPIAVITDVHEGNDTFRIAAYSASNLARLDPALPVAFIVDLESGDITPLEPAEPGVIMAGTTFSPDGETTWSGVFGPPAPALLREFDGEQQVIDLGDGEASSRPGASRYASIEWRGENTLFVPAGITRGSYILAMSGDTAATPCGCTPPENPGT